MLLPLLWEARSTARLWHHHERQRRCLGLPPERGAGAAALQLAHAHLHEHRGVSLVSLSWLLGALGWEVAVHTMSGARSPSSRIVQWTVDPVPRPTRMPSATIRAA